MWGVQSDPDALRTAAGAQQAVVRAHARSVLSAIGADTLPQDQNAGPAVAAVAAAATEPQPDLLGDLADEAAPSPPRPAPHTLPADAAAANVSYQQHGQQDVDVASEQQPLGAPLLTLHSGCRLLPREGTPQHSHSALDMNRWQQCSLDVPCCRATRQCVDCETISCRLLLLLHDVIRLCCRLVRQRRRLRLAAKPAAISFETSHGRCQ